MTATLLPFALPGCCVETVQQDGVALLITAHAEQTEALCPGCRQPSSSVHSYYRRTPADLPISDQAVRLVLRVRRFRCQNSDCIKRTFTERLPSLVAVRARRTLRLENAQAAVGFAVGGQAGARLLRQLHMPTSPDALLGIMRRQHAVPPVSPRVLGIDDWAYRKGRRYGTILIDLERRRVVDLLEDRSADTVADWLRGHPRVQIVARDRSSEYARGINEAAPHAVQVADRWHLLHNLREMLERFFRRVRGSLHALPSRACLQAPRVPRTAFPRTSSEIAASRASRSERLALYDHVQRLRRCGQNIAQIARTLGMSRGGVRTLYYAEAFPERGRHAVPSSLLEPYLPYLEARLADSCENASQLWREIREQGFPGTSRQVLRWMQPRRSRIAATTPGPYRTNVRISESAAARMPDAQQEDDRTEPPAFVPVPRIKLPSPKQLAWLLMRAPEALEADKQSVLQHILQHADLQRLQRLVRQFVLMIQQKDVHALDPWLEACAGSGVENLKSFAAGIIRDYAAVRAALETSWSSGQAEGQINRLKLLKRQMYGRAGFDLLRIRMLQTA